jgi:predicted XRE-type DNA-binding protein
MTKAIEIPDAVAHAAKTAEIRQCIATEVRAELARKQITQREAATLLRLPQGAMSLRLGGHRAFKAEELVQLATYLRVPVTTFMPNPSRELVAA